LLALLGWAETRGALDDSTAASHRLGSQPKRQMSSPSLPPAFPFRKHSLEAVGRLAQEIPRSYYPIILKPIFGTTRAGC